MFKVIAFSILDGKTTQNFKVLQERIKFDDTTDEETDWDEEDFEEEKDKIDQEDWRNYIEHHDMMNPESPVQPTAPSTTPQIHESDSLPSAFRFQPSSSAGGTSFSVPPNAFPSFSTFPPFSSSENQSADE